MSDAIDPAALLDSATRAVVAAALGSLDAPARESLTELIQTNRAALATGDAKTITAALARQAAALEIGMSGLLMMMGAACKAEDRLALARAVAVLHGAGLRTLSALHQVNKDARLAAPAQ